MCAPEANRTACLSAMLVLGFALATQHSFAQEQRKHFGGRGIVELGGSISFHSSQPVVSDKSGDFTYTTSVMPFVGYFVIDGLELGANPAGLTVVMKGDTTALRLNLLFAPSYNFRTSTIATPFVEGLAGFTSTTTTVSGFSSSKSGFTWGGRLGVKVGLVEHGLLVFGVQYLQITQNPAGSSGRNGENEFSLSAGWTIWL